MGIALLLLLLSSASTGSLTRSNCPTQVNFMNDNQKLTKLLRRNHYDYDFNTSRYQNVTYKAYFTIVHSKKVNRNAIRYRYNPSPHSTRIVQVNMPSLAKDKPTSAIKEATMKVKEKETNSKDKGTGKPKRLTKAQVSLEIEAKKDAILDDILEKEWKVDYFNDREPKDYDNSSGSSEYSGSDDEWINDDEDHNKEEDKTAEEDLTTGSTKKKKLAEGEDSHARYERLKVIPDETRGGTRKPRLVIMSKQSVMRTKMALEHERYDDDEDGLPSPNKKIPQSPKRRSDTGRESCRTLLRCHNVYDG